MRLRFERNWCPPAIEVFLGIWNGVLIQLIAPEQPSMIEKNRGKISPHCSGGASKVDRLSSEVCKVFLESNESQKKKLPNQTNDELNQTFQAHGAINALAH